MRWLDGFLGLVLDLDFGILIFVPSASDKFLVGNGKFSLICPEQEVDRRKADPVTV